MSSDNLSIVVDENNIRPLNPGLYWIKWQLDSPWGVAWYEGPEDHHPNVGCRYYKWWSFGNEDILESWPAVVGAPCCMDDAAKLAAVRGILEGLRNRAAGSVDIDEAVDALREIADVVGRQRKQGS